MSGHVVCASEKTNLRTLHCGWVMSCSLTVLVCVLFQPHSGRGLGKVKDPSLRFANTKRPRCANFCAQY